MMKPLTHSLPPTLPLLLPPSNPAALGLFWALAFSPAITHLVQPSLLIAIPLLGMGPVVAGFWLAGTLCQTRLSLAVLGALLGVLVWLVNWLMLAGGDCCSFG